MARQQVTKYALYWSFAKKEGGVALSYGLGNLNVARTKSQSLLEPHDIRLRGHQASARASRSSFL